ncbi:probable pyridoxal 5'-phosphate synthase subunit PDX2 [Gigantopelta aegis]|uniref:probable pyridoxal 5'-phosphate synthase subunit PDX2 n=1 Tax=Gigantopelta aegis TaxID=1735272 RepID=UPI001B88D0A5|nr:probable pyridoxal 5'-phosphate synthase subunit PDX2 [Gigantopelta aegis]
MPYSSSLKSRGRITVGILEIQGAFLEHQTAVTSAARSLGLEVDVEGVRQVSDIKPEIDGLIIPGGESTTIGLFLKRHHMLEPLRSWIQSSGKVTWGTCAGMILLAKGMENQKEGGQQSLQAMDVVVSRNYFGRQINSFEQEVEIVNPELITQTGSSANSSKYLGVFIRAPAVVRITEPSVHVLAYLKKGDADNKVIVACRQGNIISTAFHPELTEDTRWHRYFLNTIIANK